MELRSKPVNDFNQGVLHFLGIHDPEHPWIIFAIRLRRSLLRFDKRLRNDYLLKAPEPKLHIGGGLHRLDGWLNTDLGLLPAVMLMDATQKFPFSDETFKFVYTEHMIEHISYEQGSFMLRECHRVLQDGGIIRVTTPDLASIVDLYRTDLSEIQQRYLSWFSQAFLLPKMLPTSANAINAFFRLWGHQYIYDEETLTSALQAAGFRSIKRHRLGHSDHDALRNLENERRYPPGLLDYESVSLQASK
jgi:predicted SAM-dependent methyltransferase